MNDDRQEELAALHALDLLEGAERAEFEAALARDPLLRQRVQELREAAAALAHAAPSVEPPPELRQRILDSAGESAARGSAATSKVADSEVAGSDFAGPKGSPKSVPGKVISFPSLIPWAVAACFALAAAWAGQLYLSARSESALLRDQQKLADLELESSRTQLEEEQLITQRQIADTRQLLVARSKLEGEAKFNQQRIADLSGRLKAQGDLAQLKISILASMLGNSPQALAVAVWNPASQEGALTVSKLPAAASDKDYQLWVIDPQYKTPVSAGVFSVDSATSETPLRFKADKSVKSVAKFAISLEPKGGSPTPSTVVLISE